MNRRIAHIMILIFVALGCKKNGESDLQSATANAGTYEGILKHYINGGLVDLIRATVGIQSTGRAGEVLVLNLNFGAPFDSGYISKNKIAIPRKVVDVDSVLYVVAYGSGNFISDTLHIILNKEYRSNSDPNGYGAGYEKWIGPLARRP